MEQSGPRTFTDNAGRKWIVAITAADLKRVRLATGIRLDALIENRLRPLAELLGDLERFVNVLYLLCQSQAAEKKLSDEDFGRALVGDHIEEARDAFTRALADFSPSRIRRTLLNLAEKGAIAAERLGAIAEKELEAITPEMIEKGIMEMVSTAKSSALNLPASVEWIPAPSRSAN